MSVAPRTIAANTGFYITALTVQKVLSFLYFTILARSLGAELTGKYFFALSFATAISVFMDLGLTPLLIREAAQEIKKASVILGNVVGVKLLIAAVTFGIMAFVVPRTVPDPVVGALLWIGLIITLMDSFALTFYSTIRAHQNLLYESIGAVVFQLVVLALGTAAIAAKMDIRIIMLALLAASVVNLFFALLMLTRKLAVPIWLRFDRDVIRRLVYLAAPFAVAAIFIKVYAYIDTIMLRFMSGDVAVGLYSVAYKITFAFQFIPLAFVAALYPAFSLYAREDRAALAKTFQKSVEYLLIASFPIAAGLAGIAGSVIPHVYTIAYADSVAPLVILIVSLPFLFVNFPIGSLLNACARQTRQTVHLGITMALNILLNLYLIPRYGATGAAIASTASTLFIFMLGMVVVRQIVPSSFSSLILLFFKLLFIAVALYVAVFFISAVSSWYFAIVPGVVLYVLALLLTKTIGIRELLDAKTIIASGFRR